MQEKEIEGVLFSSLKDTVFIEQEKVGLDTPLIGPNGILDSIRLVSFIVEAEQRLQQTSGKNVKLMSEKAFSERKSPFRSVRTIIDFVLKEI